MESNLICEIHNSPVGGVCSDFTCNNTQFMCIKCIVDPISCVRIKGHKVISIKEFFSSINLVNQSEVIQLYAKIKQFNGSRLIETVMRITVMEKVKNENMKRLFESKLEELFKKEQEKVERLKIEKVQQLENVRNKLVSKRKDLVRDIINEQLLSHDVSSYKHISIVILQEYQNGKLNNQEANLKVTNLIFDMRRLLTLSQDGSLLELLNSIASYISFNNKNFISDPLKFDSHFQNFYKDLKIFLSSTEQPLNEFLNLRLDKGITKVSSKLEKKERKTPTFKSKEYKLTDYLENNKDEFPIFIPDMNFLCLYNNNSTVIYNILDKTIKFQYEFQKGEKPFETKSYITQGYRYICIFTSMGSLIIINLDALTIIVLTSDIVKTNNLINVAYDVYFNNDKPRSVVVTLLKGKFLTGHFEDNYTMKFIDSKQESIDNIIITGLKLIYTKNGLIEYIIRSSVMALDIYNSDFIKYYSFTSKKTYLAFEYIEVGNDKLIYALLPGGLIHTYSIVKKKLLKEIPISFKTIPVFCLSIFSEKKLIVGSEKRYYVVDVLDYKKNSKLYKLDTNENVREVKVFDSKPASFICLTKSIIYYFQLENNI
jgi:hypothetical protein